VLGTGIASTRVERARPAWILVRPLAALGRQQRSRPIRVRPADAGQVRIGIRAGEVDLGGVQVVIVFAQRLGCEHDLAAKGPFVGATLADLADDAAGGTTVLRAVTTDIGFLLVDRTERQAEAAQIGQRLSAEIAVDVVRVLRY